MPERRRPRPTFTSGFTLALLMSSSLAQAMPLGGQVAAGQAGITSGTNVTTINQSTSRAVINWSSFNVGQSEAVRFNQPTSSSITLNRVSSSAGISQIDGMITARGNVWVTNPNGMVFGKTATVNVGGLLATTSQISNQSFMQGRNSFTPGGNPNASIVNNGSITVAQAGLATFVAPNVVNNGTITATLGKVTLASGDSYTLDLYGDGLINLQASPAITSQLVSNSGAIKANGGAVTLTAAAAGNVVDSLINMDGVIEAEAYGNKTGSVTLYAEGSNAVQNNVTANKDIRSGGSAVLVSGVIDASGYGTGQKGGTVQVLGDNVGILSGAAIDTSGDKGGGTVRIGGDFHGAGTTPTAANTYVDPNSLILANAVTSGNGGNVTVWSDGLTQFYGNIIAEGGAKSGNGGYVETSGHGSLDAEGYVDLTAPNGAKGTYLLDPTNISIYGNVTPAFVSTDGTINLASSLVLWLDASNQSNITLSYNSIGTTASGSSGANTITVGSNTGLVVGERIQLGGSSDTLTAAVNDTANVYTITAINGTTVTLDANLGAAYSGATLYGGYVKQINDLSGNSNNAVQTTTSAMPLWISNGQNGLGDMSVSGPQWLNISVGTLSSLTLFGTYSLDTSTSSGVVFASATGTKPYFGNDGVGTELVNNAENWAGFTSVSQNTSARIDSAYSNSTTYAYFENGAQLTRTYGTGNPSGGSFTFNAFGTRTAYSMYSNDITMDGIIYNTTLSTNAQALVNQYESAKWGIALTGPGVIGSETGLTGTEAQQAMASVQAGATTDGYSVFSASYLNRLSQTSNIILQASNNINLDLQGASVSLASGKSISLIAGNQITTNSTGSITTSGGNISLTGTNGIVFSNAFTLTSGGGNINLTGAVNLGAALTANAGAGSLSFTGTVNGANNLTTTAATTTFSGIVGGATPLGSVNITTDNVTFGGNLYGTGTLTIQPETTSRAINLNNGTSGLYLSPTELAYIQSDWAGLVFGNSSDSGTMTLGAATWSNPASFLDGAGTITLAGNQTGAGAMNFTGNYVNENSGVTVNTSANNANITMAGITTLAGTLNAGTGNITITDTFNNGTSGGIILNSGADLIGGNITLLGNAVNPYYGAQVRLNSGSQINASINTILQDNGYRPDLDGQGYSGIVMNSGATINSPLLTVQTGGSEIEYNGATINTSPANITFAGGSFYLPTGITYNTQNTNFNLTGSGAIIYGTLNAGTGNITITDTVFNSYNGGIVLNSGADLIGGNITLLSNVTSSPYGAQIQINSGSQINAAASTVLRDNCSLLNYDGTGAAGVVLNSGATINSPLLTLQTGGSEIEYNGATINTSPASITFSGGNLYLPTGVTYNTHNTNFNITGSGAVIYGTLNAGTGNITITDTVFNGSGGGIVLNSGADLIGGNITLLSNNTSSPYYYGAQIRINSGSQTNASTSAVLQDNSYLPASYDGTGDAGVILNSGATITSPTLTVQTGGAELSYSGATLNVSGTTSFIRPLSGTINITSPLSLTNLVLEADTTPNITAAITATGSVQIEPYTASTTIGFAGGAGTLQVSQAIMNDISAPTVIVGSASSTGALTAGAYTWGTGLNALYLEGGNVTFGSNISWSNAGLLMAEAAGNVTINSGVSLTNTYSGTFGASAIPVLLALRGDSGGTDGGYGVTNNGTINFSGSTGAVSIFDDNSFTQVNGTQSAKSGWAAPANASVANQFTTYKLVNNATDLANIGTSATTLGYTYALGQTINGAGAAFNSNTPLGTLTGTLDGQYCALAGGTACGINNFTMNVTNGGNVGLFATNSGTVRNLALGLTVTDTSADTGTDNVGDVAGTNTGKIANVTATGAVNYVATVSGSATPTAQVGGLVGYNNGSTVINSTASGNVTYTYDGNSTGTSGVFIGGLVGNTNNLLISGSSSSGNVTAQYGSGYSGNINGLVGGLVGGNSYGSITGSTSSSAISDTLGGSSIQQIGWLAGYNGAGTISNDTNSQEGVSYTGNATAVYIGGVVGQNYGGTLTNVSSTEPVSVTSTVSGTAVSTINIGGLVGYGTYYYSQGAITNSTASGNVTYTYSGTSSGASSVSIGGLVGNNSSNAATSLSGSSSSGNVTAQYGSGYSGNVNGYVGALVGLNQGTISASTPSGAISDTLGGSDTQNIGWLAGQNSAAISNVTNSQEGISYTGNATAVNIGGLIGYEYYGSLTNVSSTEPVSVTTTVSGTATSSVNIGGLVGYITNNNTDTNITASGNVTYTYSGTSSGASSVSIGGLVGNNSSNAATSLSGSSSSSNVTAQYGSGYSGNVSGYVGGLVGYNQGTITTSTPSGAISDTLGGTDTQNIGWLAGYNSGSISNITNSQEGVSYTGNATGVNIGGIVGYQSGGALSNVSNTQTVNATSTVSGSNTSTVNIGGVIGYINNNVTMTNGTSSGNVTYTYSGTSTGTSSVNIGGVIGTSNGSNYNFASVAGSTSSGNVTAQYGSGYSGNVNADVGGLEGSNNYYSTITTSTPSGAISDTLGGTSTQNIGGLIGFSAGSISSSGNSQATVSYIGNATGVDIGGLIGYEYSGTLTNDSNSEPVNVITTVSGSAVSAINIGGLAGYMGYSANVTNSTANSNVTYTYSGTSSGTSSFNIGGLIGNSSGSNYVFNAATGSMSSGNVIAQYGSGYSGNVSGTIGGLEGSNNYYGSITNSYATGGTISDTLGGNATQIIGGLVGYNTGTVSNSYSTDYVENANASTIKGLVGSNSGTVTNSYWDTAVSGQASSNGGTAQTTSQLQASLPTGFSSSTWGIVAGYSYPYLLWQYASAPQVVSGTATGTGTAGAGVTGAANGTVFGSLTTGANGYYNFLLPTGSITSGEGILTYLTGGATGNAVRLSGGNATETGLNITANAVNETTDGATLPVSLLATAEGSLSNANILYAVSGGTATFTGGTAFNVTGGTINLNDNIVTSGGAVTFTGPVTFAGNTSITTGGGAVSFSSTLDGASAGGQSLTVNAGAGGVTFTGAVGGAEALANLTVAADALSVSGAVNATGTVTLEPGDTTTSLGFSGGAGTLQVTQAMMNGINAPTVVIGRTDSTAALTTGAFNWESTLGSLTLEGGSDTIGGNITKASGTNNAALDVISGTDITVNSNAAISSSGAYGALNTMLDSDYAGAGGAIVLNSGSSVTSNGGNITLGGGANPVMGYAVGDAVSGYGINIGGSGSAAVNSGSGSLTMNGQGYATNTSFNCGINITSGSTVQATGAGSILMTGIGGGTGNTNVNHGIAVNGVIKSTGAGGGGITLIGYSGDSGGSGNNNSGIVVYGGTVTSVDGNIMLDGNTGISGKSVSNTTGGGNIYAPDAGVFIGNGGIVSSTGNATIGINGIGAGSGSGSDDYGIFITGAGSQVTSARGNIALSGIGALTNGSLDMGIYLESGTVQTTGSATVSLTGIGGGIGGTVVDHGIQVSGTVQSTATGGGNITIIGYGGDNGGSGNNTSGAVIWGGTVTSLDGNIVLDGNTGIQGQNVSTTTGNSGANAGLYVGNAGTVSSTGNATITLTGIGAGSGSANDGYGVYLSGSGSKVTSVKSNITIAGTGANTTGGSDYGIYLQTNPTVYTTGSGNITFTGVGGNGSTGIVSTESSGVNEMGGDSDTGNITFKADTLSLASTPIQTAGVVTFAPYTASTTVGVAGGAGTLGITSSILSNVTAGSIVIGNASDTGAMTLGAESWSAPASFVTGSSGGITVSGAQAGTGSASLSFTGSTTLNANLSTANQAINLNSAVMLGGNSVINAGSGALGFGGAVNGNYNLTASAGSISFASGLGGVTPLASVSLTSAGALTLPSISSASLLAQTTGAASDLTIGTGSILAQSGANTATTLVAGRNFINDQGSNGLSDSNGRWLIYSTNPASDTFGGLTGSFNRYSCTYGGSCPSMPASGNGLLYSYTPLLTVTPTGGIAVTYGNAVPTLTAYGYSLSGYLGGDSGSDTVTGSLNGATNYTQGSNVGSYNLTYSSGSLASAMGYGFTYATNATGITVGARTVTASLTGTVDKTYDQATTATLAAGNYVLSNVYGSDAVTLNDPASGTYDTANVGTGKTVSVNGLSLGGAKAGDYVLASSSVTGAVGEIDARTISAVLGGLVDKTYDQTTAATLASGNYTLSGVLSGDTVTLNDPASGTYDTANVGTGKTVSVSGLAINGASANNYVLAATSINGAVGEIDPKTLTASLTGTVDKTYDATNAAALASGNYSLTGVISGDTVNLNNPASGSYDTANVGTGKAVSVTGLALGGISSGNYVLASTAISGNVGEIDAKTLTASLTGVVDKTYDQTTTAALTTSNYSLSGVISGDTVTLNDPAAGSYNNANVGTGKSVSVSGLSLAGGSAGNYVLAATSINGAVGEIDAKTLTASLTGLVDKTYDQTTNATLAAGNYSLSGVISGDTVGLNNPSSGTYDTANVGIGKTVSVSGLSISGAQAGNYVLASSSVSGAVGEIDARTISAVLSGLVDKTYDQTTAATLTSANYSLTGFIAGDAIGLNNPASGTYDTANVGTGKAVTVNGLSLIGASAGNYVLSSTSISGNVGEIDAKSLTASLTGLVDKTYDQTTAATLAGGNYSLSGVISGDTVNLNNPVSGSYDTANVGTGKTVSVSGLSLGGTSSGNYVLASTSISGAVGEIDAKTLTATLTGTVDKTYDQTTGATLASGNYSLTGVIGGDTVTLNNPVSGAYNTTDVGTGKTVSVSGLSLGGGSAGNYVLSSTSISATVGEIDARTLTASLTGLVDKTYDQTTAATLAAGNYSLTGVIGGDTVSLNNPVSGSYDTANAGTGKAVTVNGLSLIGASAGNYVLASTSISAAVGEIDPRTLTASLTGIVDKTYDQTTAATLASGNYSLAGVISGDTVGVAGASGTYDTANAGTAKTVSVSGLSLTGASAGNYVLSSASVSGAVGEIDPRQLTATLTGTVDKTYDQTTAAALTSGNYTLTGLLSGDAVGLNNPASGSYDTANVGTGKTVTVNGVSLTGAGADNYVLASASVSGAVGEIDPRTLTASLTGTVDKTYDQTTSATPASGNYRLSGVISGDVVNLNDPASGTYDTANVGTAKTVSVSGLGLSGASAGNYVLSSASVSGAVGEIDPRTLTVSLTGFTSKAYDGTAAATLTPANYLLSGVLGGDAVSLNDPASGTYDTPDKGTGKTVTVGGLALSGPQARDYALASATASAAIGAIGSGTVTVTADNASKVYGSANPVFTYSYADGGVPVHFTGSLLSSATSSSNVGTYAIGQGTLAASGNFTLAFAPATLTVTPATLAVTANNEARLYGALNPQLLFGYDTGGLPVRFTGSLFTPATLASLPGTYAITQGTLAAANYDLVFTPGTLSVTALPNTVTQAPASTFNNPSQAFALPSAYAMPQASTAVTVSSEAPLHAITPAAGNAAPQGIIYLDAAMMQAFGLTPNDVRSWADGMMSGN